MVKCSRCNRDAVITLHYSKESLCKEHFFKTFEKRVFNTIRVNKMIKKGQRIAVAVSGGKDSSVLLYLLKKLQKKFPFEVFGIAIDEGIAGYRDQSLKELIKLAEQLEVELHIYRTEDYGMSVDQAVKNGRFACSYCGVTRRYLLNKYARELKADSIAFGHNLDDVVQTFFMNFLRNEPLRAARFFEPIVKDKGFVRRIRPLETTPEREIAIYAILKNIPLDFRECPYSDFGLRKPVREKLNELEERFPGMKFRMYRSFRTIASMLKENIEKKSSPKLSKCKICGEPSSSEVCKFCRMVVLGED